VAGTEDWRSIATDADADELRERILSGYKDGKPFTPYEPMIALPRPIDWVLDFGCGLGRSFPYLKSVARHVAGFDLAPMIERCRVLSSERVDILTSDWSDVSTRRFDLVFASLVLQHLETEACRPFLADFARMAPATYLLTRLQSDFGVNVLKLVSESGLYDVEACAEVEHDASRHNLRQVAARPFDEVSNAGDNRHYEVLLKARRR